MKNLITRIIQKRNPHFQFDPRVSDYMLWCMAWNRSRMFLFGLRMLLKGKMPKSLLLGARVRLEYSRKITLGKWVRIDHDSRLSALGTEGITIGNNSGIGAFSSIIVSTSFQNIGSYIRIGSNVGIGEFASLGGAGGLEIGDDCIIGQYFSCHPENHIHSNPEEPIRLQGVERKGIRIGSNCWIGSKVTILDGVNIGNGCVIAAGAVVTKSFPSNSILAGVPASILRDRSGSGGVVKSTISKVRIA
jgi:acetyltransferase-like isoleucine patch superfamily enzyme